MIYVIGHKNPDTDSIVSSITYAWYLNQKGIKVLAARNGEINSETKFILKKFGFKFPISFKNIKIKEVILVDHNEKEQQPEGDFKILEIWDHHKFNFSYPEPIFIRCEPIGSTATLLAKEFLNQKIEIPKNIAGLLISAILSDTVIFKSPTTTKIDKNITQKLNEQWGFDLEIFGLEIKKAGIDFNLSINELILKDLKEYNFFGKKIGIGQFELIEIEKFLEKKGEVLKEMEDIKKKKNYNSLIFAVTDIFKEGSELFVIGEEEKIEKAFNKKIENGSCWINGLMSRKKQIVPLFEKFFS
jgi:manganese-dependent inorganic pyrophosphatase